MFWNALNCGWAVATSKARMCVGWHINYWFLKTKIYLQYFISLTKNFLHFIFLNFELSKRKKCCKLNTCVCKILFAWARRKHWFVAACIPVCFVVWEISVKSWISFALCGVFCVFLKLLWTCLGFWVVSVFKLKDFSQAEFLV